MNDELEQPPDERETTTEETGEPVESRDEIKPVSTDDPGDIIINP